MATLTADNTARGPFLSAGADGTSLLAIPGATVDGVKGKTLFLINHLEYDTAGTNADLHKPPVDLYGLLPMAMNLTFGLRPLFLAVSDVDARVSARIEYLSWNCRSLPMRSQTQVAIGSGIAILTTADRILRLVTIAAAGECEFKPPR